MKYPFARKADTRETHHGVSVPDPYRWLEDADSPDTMAWVDAQNALTRSVLDGPVREALVERLTSLYDYPRVSVPIRRGPYYFVSRNSGLQNQPVLFVQDTLAGPGRVLLDPNTLSADGTIALTAIAPSNDGALLAYALSKSGSDRQEIFVREVATGVDRPDRIEWVKFATIAWAEDGGGFYYSRFPEPGTVPPGDEHYFNRVHYHRLGDPQTVDRLVFEKPGERETVFSVDVAHGGRWVVITAFRGASDKSEVYLIDRATPQANPVPLFTGFESAYAFVDAAGGLLFFRTDHTAPRGRIVAVDPANTSQPPRPIVAESGDKLSAAVIAQQTIAAAYLHNASDRVRLFGLDGTPAGELPLPGIGALSGMDGEPDRDELFVGFTSFTFPSVAFRYDVTTSALDTFEASVTAIDPAAYETRQVWYPSKDGTSISMFLVHGRGVPMDGRRPVLLSGYGGFNISMTPAFDPSVFVLLDRGGVFALANLRGGGEYGEAWHQAGMRERKQNVFDDFIAAAEYLIASGCTRPSTLAIEGGSNGGLLTAAVMVQRPDLFGAVVCRVPVADMLRYHLFTVGRFWIPEYGSADDPDLFPVLLRYSPYHNVKDGVAYPPVLIMTADTDDRVAPGMAKKFAARLQEADGDRTPVLIRVETKAGHGAGKPVAKMIEEDADIYAFLLKYLGVE